MYHRSAFSVLQLVVVLAILLMGLALLVPIVQRIREEAARTQSTNNLKQIALAMHSFHGANKALPPALGEVQNQDGPTHFHILPYVEQQPLYQRGEGASWKNGVYGTVVKIFVDPRDASLPGNVYKNWLASTNYAVNYMVTRDGKTTFNNITDGTSNTLMFAERYQMCNGAPTAWGYPSYYTWAPMFAYYNNGKFESAPQQEKCDPTVPQSISGAILVALCDGSVRSISPAVGPLTWVYLSDPADGNPLPDDAFD